MFLTIRLCQFPKRNHELNYDQLPRTWQEPYDGRTVAILTSLDVDTRRSGESLARQPNRSVMDWYPWLYARVRGLRFHHWWSLPQKTEDALPAFIVPYGLLQAFGHMGPGASIGFIPIESFPTAAGGMEYGKAAGFGKAEAAIGTQVFTLIRLAAGPSSTFYVAGGIGIFTSVVDNFLPKGAREDLKRAEKDFEIMLDKQGI